MAHMKMTTETNLFEGNLTFLIYNENRMSKTKIKYTVKPCY
jgi:hypothetical protein